jgi:uncharacterized protein (TIGR03118 family)
MDRRVPAGNDMAQRPPARGSRARRRALLPLAAAVALTTVTAVLGAGAADAAPKHPNRFLQVNLVSDQPGMATLTDPELVNAWGLSASPGTDTTPGSPVWVSDNGTDATTLYAGASPTSVSKVLSVHVTSGAPTGQVFNPDATGFVVHDAAGNAGSARFIFASENGAIDGWNPVVGATSPPLPSTVTEVAVDNGANAVYKGLAIAQAGDGHWYLYAANFRSGRIEVYDDTFTPTQLPGGPFSDPGIPGRYAPFNVQELNGMLYVSYARRDRALMDDVAGPGHGFVDVFTNDGALVMRLISRGVLNSPWGLAIAPEGFGHLDGDLLVGNFGDGRINVFDPMTGASKGMLRTVGGHAIVIDGLWALMFGNGNAAKTNELLFSAGPDDESHGLLGKIVALR